MRTFRPPGQRGDGAESAHFQRCSGERIVRRIQLAPGTMRLQGRVGAFNQLGGLLYKAQTAALRCRLALQDGELC